MVRVSVFVKRREMLSRDKKKSGNALHTAGLAALSEGLRRLYGIDGEVRIEKEAGGKPFLADYPEIFFNISHSGELAVCAVADVPVGVDVQVVRVKSMDRIAERFFSAEDRRAYREAGDRERAFCRIWTEMEAYGKWLGTGLSETIGKPRESGCGTHFFVGEDYEAAVWTAGEAQVTVWKL